MKDSFKEIFESKKKVLLVMPHPDDCELYAGGTVARLVREGYEVRVIKMTLGEKGCRQEDISSEDLKIIRKKEDSASMNILGIKDDNNIYLDLGDGAVESDMETIGKIAFQIREFNPDLIITTNPEDMIIRFAKGINWMNHRDHLNTAKATLFASYPYSRDISFFPEHLTKKGVDSHECTEFLLVDFHGHQDEVLIDVTEDIETRVKAHSCHSSQYSPEDAQDSADFFTKLQRYTDGKRYENFRYVVVD